MKFPFTEQVLWGLYLACEDFCDDVEKILSPFPSLNFPYEFSKGTRRNEIWKYYSRKMRRRRFQQLISYLKTKGWITVKIDDNGEALLLTPKGKTRALKIFNTKIKAKNLQKRKDDRWQMIMYDIPKRHSNKRFSFADDLKDLGYKMIQKSIWVSPYSVLKETKELVENYQLQDFVKILLVQEIEL